jgi:hypothetical protein
VNDTQDPQVGARSLIEFRLRRALSLLGAQARQATASGKAAEVVRLEAMREAVCEAIRAVRGTSELDGDLAGLQERIAALKTNTDALLHLAPSAGEIVAASLAGRSCALSRAAATVRQVRREASLPAHA